MLSHFTCCFPSQGLMKSQTSLSEAKTSCHAMCLWLHVCFCLFFKQCAYVVPCKRDLLITHGVISLAYTQLIQREGHLSLTLAMTLPCLHLEDYMAGRVGCCPATCKGFLAGKTQFTGMLVGQNTEDSLFPLSPRRWRPSEVPCCIFPALLTHLLGVFP